LYNGTLETERQSLSYAKANHPVSYQNVGLGINRVNYRLLQTIKLLIVRLKLIVHAVE